MKKDNTIYFVLGAGALIGGGYYAYKKGLLDKILGKSTKPEIKSGTSTTSVMNQENKLAALENKVETSYTPLTNPNSFQSKVAKIQTNIGAKPDGIVGPETNRMFAAKYGLDKGDIAPQTIDYYLGRVVANNTLAQIQALKARATEALNKAGQANASVAQKAAAFKAAWFGGAKTFVLVTGYNAPMGFFNAVNNSVSNTGQTKAFSAGRLSVPTDVIFGTSTASLSFDKKKTFYAFPIAILTLQK
jgi:hypothetical protein